MFTPQLREHTRQLHTSQQLQGYVNQRWLNQHHVVSYLVRRHHVHRVLDTVLDVDTGLRPRLEHDLTTLDIDWKHSTTQPPVYVDYLQSLAHAPGHRPAIIAHYYAFVLAHLVGGGRQIANSASPVLPPWFLDQSEYYAPNTDRASEILTRIDEEAAYWSRDDDRMCLDEVSVAFRFGMTMLHQK